MGQARNVADTLLKRLSVLLFMGKVLGVSFEVTRKLPSPGGQQEGWLLSALAAPASNFVRVQPCNLLEELQTMTARQAAAFGMAGAHGDSLPTRWLKAAPGVGAKYPQPAQGQQLVDSARPPLPGASRWSLSRTASLSESRATPAPQALAVMARLRQPCMAPFE